MGHCTRLLLAVALIGLAISCSPQRTPESTRAISDEIEKLGESISQQAIAALIKTDALTLRKLGLSAARTQFAFRDYRMLGVTPISTTGEFLSDGTSHGVYSRLYRIAIGGGRYLRIRCIFDGPNTLTGLNLIEDPSPGGAATSPDSPPRESRSPDSRFSDAPPPPTASPASVPTTSPATLPDSRTPP